MTRPVATTSLAALTVAATFGATAGLACAQEAGSVPRRPQTCQRGVLRLSPRGEEPGALDQSRCTDFAAIANTKGVTRTALFAMLQTSHKKMPNLVIKGDDAQNIIAYILSLKDGD